MLIEQHIYVDSFVVDVLSSMRFHEYLIGFIRLSKVIVHRELLCKAKKKNNSYTNNESESTSVDYNRTPEVVETFNKICEILLLMLCRNSEIKKLLLQNLDLFSYDTKSAIDSNTSFGKLVKEVLKFSNKDIDFYECDKIHNIWKDRFKFNKTNRMQEHIIIDNKLEDTEIPEIISRISKCIVNK